MDTVQVETRLTRLETKVEHMGSDIAEIKGQLREGFAEVNRKFEALLISMNDKHTQLIEKMGEMNVKISDIKVWSLIVLGGGLGLGILGVLARALHWI